MTDSSGTTYAGVVSIQPVADAIERSSMQLGLDVRRTTDERNRIVIQTGRRDWWSMSLFSYCPQKATWTLEQQRATAKITCDSRMHHSCTVLRVFLLGVGIALLVNLVRMFVNVTEGRSPVTLGTLIVVYASGVGSLVLILYSYYLFRTASAVLVWEAVHGVADSQAGILRPITGLLADWNFRWSLAYMALLTGSLCLGIFWHRLNSLQPFFAVHLLFIVLPLGLWLVHLCADRAASERALFASAGLPGLASNSLIGAGTLALQLVADDCGWMLVLVAPAVWGLTLGLWSTQIWPLLRSQMIRQRASLDNAGFRTFARDTAVSWRTRFSVVCFWAFFTAAWLLGCGLGLALGPWGIVPTAACGAMVALSVWQLIHQNTSDRSKLSRLTAETQRNHPELVRIVQDLCRKAGVVQARPCIVNDRRVTARAYTFGLCRRETYVAVGKFAYEVMRQDEDALKGMLAHEVAHLKKHVWIVCVARLFGRFSLVGDTFSMGVLDTFGIEHTADSACQEFGVDPSCTRKFLVCLRHWRGLPVTRTEHGDSAENLGASLGAWGEMDELGNTALATTAERSLGFALRAFLALYCRPYRFIYWHPDLESRIRALDALAETTGPKRKEQRA